DYYCDSWDSSGTQF
nr:immunoglobulin light chain junction region [Macaca mulatta]MOV66292.1 immunoglobulin light chain junction region [Macaca mulatta]MOV66610.1 immunoglobulin light chain junction region [Macaca mulatta]MOV66654.1 immunoglobulin light chain junction region [Macaca mulatta]MOV66664.1 immunoglobulin light chain junction region [Macaca mulatta]